MTELNKKVILKSRIERIWDVVTDLNDYSWRSDLEN